MLLGKPASNTRRGTSLSLLVPLFHPGIGANGVGVLPHGSALLVVVGLLCAQNPFIVTVPAMKSLVLGGKAFVTRNGTDLFDHGENGFLFLVQVGNRGGENL